MKLAADKDLMSKLNAERRLLDSSNTPAVTQVEKQETSLKHCSIRDPNSRNLNASNIEMFGSMECPEQMVETIHDIEVGFSKGYKPKLTDDGTSGTYIFRGSAKQALAVFKPIDEEAFAPNNPRDHIGPFGSKSFRAGVLSGEACIREVAAYLLDTDGFSGVPPTTMVETFNDSLKSFKSSHFKIISQCNDYVEMISSVIAPENQVHNLGKDETIENARFLKIGSLQNFV